MLLASEAIKHVVTDASVTESPFVMIEPTIAASIDVAWDRLGRLAENGFEVLLKVGIRLINRHSPVAEDLKPAQPCSTEMESKLYVEAAEQPATRDKVVPLNDG